MNDDETPWLTVQAAAKRAQVGESMIYAAIHRGELRAARVSRRKFRIHLEWLDAWLSAAAPVVNEDAPGPALVYRPRQTQ